MFNLNRMNTLKLPSLFVVLVMCSCPQVFSQQNDGFVSRVEKLRKANALTVKEYDGKTYVGSLTGYYEGGSLVLINSLTDAEFGGTETLYYINDSSLHSVYVSSASFTSSGEWVGYFTKHKVFDHCESCHGKKACFTLAITFNGSGRPRVVATENGRLKPLNDDEKDKAVSDVKKTRKELEAMLSEL